MLGDKDSEIGAIAAIAPLAAPPLTKKISAVAREHGLRIDGFEIVDVADSEAAAIKGVELIRESQRRASDEGQPPHG